MVLGLEEQELTNKNLSGPEDAIIVLAGATGDLGFKIAKELLQRKARVRALIRQGSSGKNATTLHKLGAQIVEVNFNSITELTHACAGASCVVSALSGLREVIVDIQTRLLRAAVNAGVPRFIPSDYAIDFTKLSPGTNRNLDLRREFYEQIEKAPIKATSILNGMFTDLLTGQAPVVLFKLNRIMYWGNANQLLDFTTINDTAAYTAAAALDPDTPRFLRIAGDVLNIRGLQQAASEATGNNFHLLHFGSLGVLANMIKVTRALYPKNKEVFPPWQGMQYLHNMLSGLPKLAPLDNNRYPHIRWTSVQEVLASHVAK